jgi:autotransporter-associated beta strand protein
VGAGTLVLGGTDSYTGTTIVGAGTLQLDGAIVSGIVVRPHATLRGDGTTGNIAVQAHGILTPDDHMPGALHTGNVVLRAHAELDIRLGAHRHGELDVTGHINLGGATLDLTLLAGFRPAAGRQFEIIANDGTDPIHGRFAGLHQGDTFTVGGELFSINYHAHGNDVVLTALGTPASGWGPSAPTSDHTASVAAPALTTHGDFLLA